MSDYTSKDLDKELTIPAFTPSKEDVDLNAYIDKRQREMQNYREQLGIEKEWRDADIEYPPHELDFGTGLKRFEQDQDTGLRSRMVPVGDATENWRSANSAPTLLVKIQTALATIIDNDPEGVGVPMFRKYEKWTSLVNAVWKRNWGIAGGKENLKKFVFNLFKYGWAVGRSHPKIIKFPKSVLTEVDTENPENNVYEERELVWFNDVAKDNLDPFTTWVDENTKPYDQYSTDDVYYEMDYPYDQAEIEFGQYPNWKYVPKSAKMTRDKGQSTNTNASVGSGTITDDQMKERKDIVTIGFYEKRTKDLFVIRVPSVSIILHTCPLPNDDGLLSLWHTPLMLRSATSPYGISLWQILRQDKAMYDKWDNMTSDQLTLSIMKFGYYTGTSGLIGDGTIKIEPGLARQTIGAKVDWMEIPGPGKDAYEGLKMREDRMDSNTGLSPTLEGDLTGKTLGEIQLAREASLKRLKTPLENIAYAVEQDFYLTTSWSSQILSIPEVKQFADEEEMREYEEEVGRDNGGFNTQTDAEGNPTGIEATFYPELALHLEDRDGQLFESEKSRFFQVGKDIMGKDLKWRGIFKVIPKSMVGDSEIILQQTKTQMANMLIPLLGMPPELAKKPAEQILKIHDEDPKDWLPNAWLQEQQPQEQPLFTQGGESGGEPMQAGGMGQPQGQTVVPKAEISTPSMKQMVGGGTQMFRQ